jgi:ATP-dependent DNA helicase RecG
MLKDKIVKIIKEGEGLCIEFKECKNEINKGVYETVCAFLNRNGGELLLGVNDSGEITGIEKDRIYSENSNKPHVHGIINPKNFTPYPKNPVIAGVFKQIGNADDLGSGVRNLVKYTKLYSHREPEIHDEDIFKVIIPIPQGTMEATMEATTQDERMRKIIEFSTVPKTAIQIMEMIGLKNKEHFRLEILKPLIEKKILLLTIPDKPNSPKQKYYSKK